MKLCVSVYIRESFFGQVSYKKGPWWAKDIYRIYWYEKLIFYLNPPLMIRVQSDN